MRTKSLLPIDEIFALESKVKSYKKDSKKEDIIDELLDLLLLSLSDGIESANSDTDGHYSPSTSTVEDIVYRPVDGKTWVDRVNEYLDSGTEADIVRVIRTETHRVYNEGAYKCAKENGASFKTWMCMMLPSSRDTHVYLDNVTVPIEADFYTYNGNKTMFPGQFGIAEEDCNCLCELTYQK